MADSGAIANQAKGYIVPARQILISPQVSGRIVKLNIQEGQRVKAGEVLAAIEDTEYRAERDRAKAARDMAEWTAKELEEGFRKQEKAQAAAELREAEIQRDYWRSLTERYRRLLETRTIPQEQFDDALTRFNAAEQRATKLANALYLIEIGARDERRKIAAADLARAEAELGQGRVAAGQLHDRRADQEAGRRHAGRLHHPPQERRGGQPRQPDRHARLL